MSKVHIELNSNAVPVHSNLGDRVVSLLYLTVSPTVYNTLSATNFIPLVNPGTTPEIPVGSTAAQISDLRYAHTTPALLFNKYGPTEKALCQQILSAFDKLFVQFLQHCYVD